MNALRQYLKPENGILKVVLPDDWSDKEVEVIILPLVSEATTDKIKEKPDRTRFRGALAHISQEEKNKMGTFFEDIRNEWKSDI